MEKYLFLILIICSMFYCTRDVAGTNDETSSGIALYKPDGNPAVGAIVRFYIVGDTSKQYVHQRGCSRLQSARKIYRLKRTISLT